LVGGHYTAEEQQRIVVSTTTDERRESTTRYKPLCISAPGDSHCFIEISGLQVQRLLNTLQHGTDDDDDEMQLAAQTAQQLESRRRRRLNYAELASQRGKRYLAIALSHDLSIVNNTSLERQSCRKL